MGGVIREVKPPAPTHPLRGYTNIVNNIYIRLYVWFILLSPARPPSLPPPLLLPPSELLSLWFLVCAVSPTVCLDCSPPVSPLSSPSLLSYCYLLGGGGRGAGPRLSGRECEVASTNRGRTDVLFAVLPASTAAICAFACWGWVAASMVLRSGFST